MNETFDKLDNEFNTPATVENPTKELEVFQQQKNELVAKTVQVKTLEDKEFLQTEIKSLIENSKRVLDIIQKDIKIGSPPRMAEVYAKLLTSTIEGIRELRELNQTLANMQMFKDSDEVPKATLNVKMTGKELISLIKSAKDNSQMKEISAEFQKNDKEPFEAG